MEQNKHIRYRFIYKYQAIEEPIATQTVEGIDPLNKRTKNEHQPLIQTEPYINVCQSRFKSVTPTADPHDVDLGIQLLRGRQAKTADPTAGQSGSSDEFIPSASPDDYLYSAKKAYGRSRSVEFDSTHRPGPTGIKVPMGRCHVSAGSTGRSRSRVRWRGHASMSFSFSVNNR